MRVRFAAVLCLLASVLSAAPKFVVTPYVQHPATDAMSIIFFTDSACAATVSYSAEPKVVEGEPKPDAFFFKAKVETGK